MLRIACADVDQIVVVRTCETTVMYCPVVGDTEQLLRQARTLLDDDELAIIRAACGTTGASDSTYLRWWPVVCPCVIPAALRSELDATPCPLHTSVAAVMSDWEMSA